MRQYLALACCASLALLCGCGGKKKKDRCEKQYERARKCSIEKRSRSEFLGLCRSKTDRLTREKLECSRYSDCGQFRHCLGAAGARSYLRGSRRRERAKKDAKKRQVNDAIAKAKARAEAAARRHPGAANVSVPKPPYAVPARPSAGTPPLRLYPPKPDKQGLLQRLENVSRAGLKAALALRDRHTRVRALGKLCNISSARSATLVDKIAKAMRDDTKNLSQGLVREHDKLARCITQASPATRAEILKDVMGYAASCRPGCASVTPPFILEHAGPALARLSPSELEPLLALAWKILGVPNIPDSVWRAIEGILKASAALPPAKAGAILKRLEGQVSRAVQPEYAWFIPRLDLARAWIALAKRHPAEFGRAEAAIYRLGSERKWLSRALAPYFEALPTDDPAVVKAALSRAKKVSAKLQQPGRAGILLACIHGASRLMAHHGPKHRAQLASLLALMEPSVRVQAQLNAIKHLAARQPAAAVKQATASLRPLAKLKSAYDRRYFIKQLLAALKEIPAAKLGGFLKKLHRLVQRTFKDKADAAEVLWTSARLVHGVDPASATGYLAKALERARAIEKPHPRAIALARLARVHEQLKQPEPAKLLAEALKAHEGIRWDSDWRKLLQRSAELQSPAAVAVTAQMAAAYCKRPGSRRYRKYELGYILGLTRVASKLPRPAAETLLLDAWKTAEGSLKDHDKYRALLAVVVALARAGSSHLPVLIYRAADPQGRSGYSVKREAFYFGAVATTLLPTGLREALLTRLEKWAADKLPSSDQSYYRGHMALGLLAGVKDVGAVRLARLGEHRFYLPSSADDFTQALYRSPAELEAYLADMPAGEARASLATLMVGQLDKLLKKTK
jgi:hypothetical protein